MKEEDLATLPPADLELDSMSYFGSKDQSLQFKDIVLRAIEKCRVEGSKEMSKGGQKSVFSRDLNDWITINLPDQRQLHKQTIIQLYDLLIWYFDDEAKNKFKEIEEDINTSYDIFYQRYLQAEYWQPYKEEAFYTKIIKSGKDSNVGSFFLQQYEDHVFNCYRKMYQELILLFKRKNELSKIKTLSYDE